MQQAPFQLKKVKTYLRTLTDEILKQMKNLDFDQPLTDQMTFELTNDWLISHPWG